MHQPRPIDPKSPACLTNHTYTVDLATMSLMRPLADEELLDALVGQAEDVGGVSHA